MSREFPSQPLVGIGAVVFREDQVLLVRRACPPRAGEWSLPGGLQQLGETVYQAAAREVMEETRIVIRPLALIDVVDLIEHAPSDGRVRWHYTLIDILALWESGDPQASDDAAAVQWADETHLKRLDLWPETLRIIARARQLLSESRRGER